jgi:hypothetical protein
MSRNRIYALMAVTIMVMIVSGLPGCKNPEQDLTDMEKAQRVCGTNGVKSFSQDSSYEYHFDCFTPGEPKN